MCIRDRHYKYKFALDLYHGIAIGKHDPSEIKEILTQVEEKPAPVVPPKDIKVVRPKKIDEDVLLIDKNVDNVEYKFCLLYTSCTHKMIQPSHRHNAW